VQGKQTEWQAAPCTALVEKLRVTLGTPHHSEHRRNHVGILRPTHSKEVVAVLIAYLHQPHS
jgi:hypothetical protein